MFDLFNLGMCGTVWGIVWGFMRGLLGEGDHSGLYRGLHNMGAHLWLLVQTLLWDFDGWKQQRNLRKIQDV